MGGVIFILSVFLMALFMTVQAAWRFPFTWIAYDDPLVITAAAGLIMYFSQLKIRPNRFINFVAASAFSVYLLHCSPFVFRQAFVPEVRHIFVSGGGIMVIISLVIIFAVAIILDQPRKFIWKYLSSRFFS